MNILSVENLTKTYGDKILFKDINIGIDSEDKIGLIGINGTGKSTLLRVLAGLIPPDEGQVVTGGKVKIHYLSQNPVFEENSTVLEQVFNTDDPLMKTIYEYHQTLKELEAWPLKEGLEMKLNQLSVRIDEAKAWEVEADAKMVLTKLGISQFEKPIEELSGGQRKRVALARALVTPCQLLILDEPTNHIDNETLEWLEQFLMKRKGALLLITHDRYFLERVVNEIWELDKERLHFYPGNYSRFLEIKAEREEQEESIALKRKSLLRQELAWMRKGAKARTTKQKARIGRFEALQAASSEVVSEEMDIKVASKRLGKKVLELTDISKGFDNKNLIEALSLIIKPGDRIGIIGPNGTGKSTLLNIIFGQLSPNEGVVDIGPTVRMAYYDQESQYLKDDQRVIDYIKEVAEIIHTPDGEVITATQMLERFLFPGHQQWSYIGKLSGGEKRRLYLLRILMSEPNVLLLDEPTNDLDIQTLTILEDYLDRFPGVAIIVSHDRYFLDRTVNYLLSFEGDGKVTQFTGNYSEYQEVRARRLRETQQKDMESKQLNAEKTASSNTQQTKQKTKFTFKEQKEFDEIEEVIANLEAVINSTKEEIMAGSNDYLFLQELTEKEAKLEAELNQKLDRWTELTEMSEEFERLKAQR